VYPLARPLAALGVIVVLAGCTKSGTGGASTDVVTIHHTTTETVAAPTTTGASYTPPAAVAVAPLGKSNAAMPAGETEASCPYISNTDLADAEGDHVYRTAQLTNTKPVGCRFYFYSAPFQAIADIVPTTFDNASDARSAMIATAEASKSGVPPVSVPNLIPGVDAVLYKTAFNPTDANNDWACVFAKEAVMVIVHTQQTNVSFNAKAIAAQIAPRF
jgi:hypothetical protein